MTKFASIPLAPSDPILGLTQAFLQDPREEKINLGVGLFKDAHLKTPIFAPVKEAEKRLLNIETTKEYLPISGDPAYLEAVGKLVFGKKLWAQHKPRIAAFQTPGGSGALRMGATFLKEEIKSSVWISNPSWPNHKGIFSSAGLHVASYPYYQIQNHKLLFQEVIYTFNTLPELSTVVLHACCHNPTGTDLSHKQWQEVQNICQKRHLLPFFDFAYQGLGKGIEEDAYAVRNYLETGEEMLVAVSHSKNLGLYSERVGTLFIVCQNGKDQERVTSRVKQMIRTNYSNPPSHGAKVAAIVLNDLYSSFKKELSDIRERITSMRHLLVPQFPHLKECQGLFAFLGLHEEQVHILIKKHAIYMPSDGRINVCGLTPQNVQRVIEAVKTL